MDIEKTVLAFAEKHEMFPPSGAILAAVSGGADSICLLHLLHVMSQSAGFPVAAAHFNHRLRGADAEEDARFVREFCAARNIPCFVGEGDVAGFAARSGRSVEDAGRHLRYAFLEKTADDIGAARIATAHTADDNTETVLLNLCRGAGLRGLGGIPPVRGRIIRPLLAVSRKQVEAYLAEHGLPHREDRSNGEDIYFRNKLRHQVIPVLKELNPALDDVVHAMTVSLRSDEAFLISLAESFLARYPDRRLPITELLALSEPVRARVIRLACPTGLSARQVAAVNGLCASDEAAGQLSLPGICAYKEYGYLLFAQAPEPLSFEPVTLRPGETASLPALGWRVSCERVESAPIIHKSFTTYLFNRDQICGNIILRPRAEGDVLSLPGRGTKKLKKWFSEQNIPPRFRDRYPVIADDRGVLAVAGIGTDVRAAAEPGDRAMKIIIEEITEHDKRY